MQDAICEIGPPWEMGIHLLLQPTFLSAFSELPRLLEWQCCGRSFRFQRRLYRLRSVHDLPADVENPFSDRRHHFSPSGSAPKAGEQIDVVRIHRFLWLHRRRRSACRRMVFISLRSMQEGRRRWQDCWQADSGLRRIHQAERSSGECSVPFWHSVTGFAFRLNAVYPSAFQRFCKR